METVLIVIICLVVAIGGAWEVASHKHHCHGKLPEDIQ